jgi:predicted enzyme involved in methoxymalonyl-ACP biosynthesis
MLSCKVIKQRIENAAFKFVCDNTRNTPITDEILDKTFRNVCIKPKKEWYPAIKKRIEELKQNQLVKFCGE